MLEKQKWYTGAIVCIAASGCGPAPQETSPVPTTPTAVPVQADPTPAPYLPPESPTPLPGGSGGLTCDPLNPPPVVYWDPDQDGFGSVEASCADAPFLSLRRGDCDEAATWVHPGAVDYPGDGLDADCGGTDGLDPHVGLNAASLSFEDALQAAENGQRVWVGPGSYDSDTDMTILPGVQVLSTDGQTATAFMGSSLGGIQVGKTSASAPALLDGFTLSQNVYNEVGVLNVQGPFVLSNLRFVPPCETYHGAMSISNVQGGELRSIEIEGCEGRSSGGVNIFDSTVRLEDISISDTIGKFEAAGLYLYQSQVWAEGLRVERAKTLPPTYEGETAGGGGVVLEADSILTLQGENRIEDCQSMTQGGGLGVFGSTLISDGDLWIVDNRSVLEGGGIAAVGAQITIRGGTIEGNNGSSGGGLATLEDSILELQNVTFTDNDAVATDAEGEQPPTEGGGLLAHGGDVLLAEVVFEANVAQLGGGAYLMNQASLQVESSIFEDNEASQSGGGAYVFSYQAAGQLRDLAFYGNSAGNGGGLVIENPTMLSGARFVSNSAESQGGALLLLNSSASGLELIDNEAGLMGGGLMVSGASSSLRALTLTSNRAPAGAGMAVDTQTSVSLTEATLMDNVALDSGGGLSLLQDSTLTARALSIQGNRAGLFGGGLQAYGARVSLSECGIQNNVTDGYGGGIHSETGTLTLSDCLLSENQALDGGGMVALSPLALTRTTVTHNTASQRGGGIELSSGAYPLALDSSVLFSFNSAGDTGGGVHATNCYTPNYAQFQEASYLENEAPLYPNNSCLQN